MSFRSALTRLAAACLLTAAWSATGTAATPVSNPDVQLTCGGKIIMVLDESSSIHDANATGSVRNAAMAFAQGISGTGSQLAIVEFGTRARTPIGFTTVNSGALAPSGPIYRYVHALPGAPDGGYSPPPSSEFGVEYTNWEDAFLRVAELNGNEPAPLVIFITDGDPTAFNTGGGNVAIQQPVDGPALHNAITNANAVKRSPDGAPRSHVLAVGVGPGVQSPASLGRLQAISGTDAPVTDVTQLNIRTDDVLAVPTYAGLESVLISLARSLCQASITIRKEVDNANSGRWTAAGAGWTFRARVEPAPTSWVTPASPTAGLPADTTRQVTTRADSAADFRWNMATPNPADVTITEVQRTGMRLAQIICVRTDAEGRTVQTLRPAIRSNTNWSLPVRGGDAWTCTARNNLAPTRLGITKHGPATAEAGQLVTYRVQVRNVGRLVARGVTVTDTIPAGMTYVRASIRMRVVRGQVTANIGNLNPGQTRTFTITFRTSQSAGLRTNVVQARALNANRVVARARTRVATVRGVSRPVPAVVG